MTSPGSQPITGRSGSIGGAPAAAPGSQNLQCPGESCGPRPGIGQANLVFEHYVEGSLTRFTAIFWSQTPPRVGSVRSARLLDLEIPAMYDTLFAYSGASEPIRQKIADLPFAPRAFEGVTTGAPLYYRDMGIEVPHNMFTVPAEVWKRAEALGLNDPPADLGGMVFRAAPPDTPERATTIAIDYGPDDVQWTYDPASGLYRRTVDGQPHLDANTQEQVTAANVVLIYAHHQPDLAIVESSFAGSMSFSPRPNRTLGRRWSAAMGGCIAAIGCAGGGFSFMGRRRDDVEALSRLHTWFQVVPLDFEDVTLTEE